MPDSIVNYADCWERYKNSRNQTSYPFPESWKELNAKTYGVRKGELVLIKSGSGMGKTQFMRELKDHYHETTDFKFADIALEEDLGDTMGGLISLRLNKRISLPDVEVTEEEEREAFLHYFEDQRWSGYDHFGGMDDDNLFSKLRFYGASGHKMVFLDHLSIIVSEYAAEGGERERIDTIMTKLAKMAKELGLIIFLIVHLRKTSGGTSFEEGGLPTLDDLRGSGSLKQLSMTIIALSRNQQHHDPFCANTTLATVLKCRFTGRTGSAEYFYFNDKTGRMNVVPCPPGYHPEKNNQGGRANLSKQPF
jgi:twinkle protein